MRRHGKKYPILERYMVVNRCRSMKTCKPDDRIAEKFVNIAPIDDVSEADSQDDWHLVNSYATQQG